MIRPRLAPKCFRASSFWTSATGAALSSAFLAAPDVALGLWNSLPGNLREFVPDNIGLLVSVLLFVATAIARCWKQAALHEGEE
jgi:hypothetical protein